MRKSCNSSISVLAIACQSYQVVVPQEVVVKVAYANVVPYGIDAVVARTPYASIGNSAGNVAAECVGDGAHKNY